MKENLKTEINSMLERATEEQLRCCYFFMEHMTRGQAPKNMGEKETMQSGKNE